MAREERARAARLGERAEALVCDHLQGRGYTIVARRARVGRLEIDVIAERGGLLVFVEVRARRSGAFVSPLATITHKKIARIRAAAATWLRARRLHGRAVRFDAAAVTFDDPRGAIDYVEDAF